MGKRESTTTTLDTGQMSLGLRYGGEELQRELFGTNVQIARENPLNDDYQLWQALTSREKRDPQLMLISPETIDFSLQWSPMSDHFFAGAANLIRNYVAQKHISLDDKRVSGKRYSVSQFTQVIPALYALTGINIETPYHGNLFTAQSPSGESEYLRLGIARHFVHEQFQKLIRSSHPSFDNLEASVELALQIKRARETKGPFQKNRVVKYIKDILLKHWNKQKHSLVSDSNGIDDAMLATVKAESFQMYIDDMATWYAQSDLMGSNQKCGWPEFWFDARGSTEQAFTFSSAFPRRFQSNMRLDLLMETPQAYFVSDWKGSFHVPKPGSIDQDILLFKTGLMALAGANLLAGNFGVANKRRMVYNQIPNKPVIFRYIGHQFVCGQGFVLRPYQTVLTPEFFREFDEQLQVVAQLMQITTRQQIEAIIQGNPAMTQTFLDWHCE